MIGMFRLRATCSTNFSWYSAARTTASHASLGSRGDCSPAAITYMSPTAFSRLHCIFAAHRSNAENSSLMNRIVVVGSIC